nr:TetR/AcrR family transcriptional regulator C-terminal domain-containing protein [Gordonia spumicola]
METTPRRGRPPKNAAKLSRARIVDAALEAIDSGGIGSVSMRSVARSMNADPKSLYNHVAGIDDLLDAVAERILGSIGAPPRTGDTRADLTAVADAFRTATLAHRAAAPLILTRQMSSLDGLAPVDATLSVLVDAGASADDAVHLLRTFVAALVGALLREVNAGPTFGTSDVETIARRESDLATAGLRAVADAAAALARFDAAAEYRYTVDFLIDGALARIDGAATQRVPDRPHAATVGP